MLPAVWAPCSFLGPPLAEMVRLDVKPALMTAIESTFAKSPQNPAWQPTRTSRAASGAVAKAAAGGGAGAKKKGAAAALPQAFTADDLLPRNDISAQVGIGCLVLPSSNIQRHLKK